MSHSPVRSLVAQALAPMENKPGLVDTSEMVVATFDAAAAIGAEAVAGSGTGLDHFAGERVLASAFLRDTPKGHEHRLACAITDRRTCISGWSSMTGPLTFNKHHTSIAHAELRGVDVKTTMLANVVILHGAGAKIELPYGEAVKMLGGFYEALAHRIPPAHRVEPPTPFVAPTDDDPSGARAAAQGLWVEDPAAWQTLDAIARATDEGRMGADAGRDLAGRVVLAHRSRLGGPGMCEGTWVSPMTAQDLGHTFVRIFGPPVSHAQPGPGVDQLEFTIDPRRDPVGAAVTALGVASYVGLGYGFSPGRVIANALTKRQPVTLLRVLFTEREGHSRYRLQARGAALEQVDSLMAHGIHQALIAASYRVLERRSQIGWRPSYDEIMMVV